MAILSTLIGDDVNVLVIFTYYAEINESNFHLLPAPEAYRDAEVELEQVFIGERIDILSLLSQEIIGNLEAECAEAWEGPEEEPEARRERNRRDK